MPVRRVSPQEARDLIEKEGYVYLDVRSTGEFNQGHPTGSYNVPLAEPRGGAMAPNPEFLPVVEKAFGKDAKLVVGCAVGGRSARACAALEAAGFANVVDQRAGFDGARDAFGRVSEPGWGRVGLPTASGPDAERGYGALSKQ